MFDLAAQIMMSKLSLKDDQFPNDKWRANQQQGGGGSHQAGLKGDIPPGN